MILKSVREIQGQIRQTHPGLPVFMLGHSFGSVVARSFSQAYSREFPLAGMILSGAMQQAVGLLRAGLGLVALQNIVYSSRHRSKLMIRMGYGQYAKYFKPVRSDFDWLSSDPAVVDAYLADPKCGYACTLGFYQSMFRALIDNWSCRNIGKLPPDLPVLLLGGELDPAIRFGADTRNLLKKYRHCGLNKAELRLFAGGRHEMLNERNKKETWEYILEWLIHNSPNS
jgi:alpha-beta hydrolase superfamily lysophospholipase